MRLLVVEDNATNQLVARSVLQKYGIVPDAAGNGLEAVEAVRHKLYDVVLMDVHMPEMDGLQATKSIRAFKGPEARVPIIALTAIALAGDIAQCRAAGMNSHVSKPFRKEELVVALGDALRGRGVFAEQSVAANAAESMAPVIDWRIIDEFLADAGEDMLRLLLDTFVSEAVANLNRFASLGIDETSNKEAVRLAHSLKGASAMAGAVALSRTAARLEHILEQENGQIEAKDLNELVAHFVGYQTQLQERGWAAAA